MGLISGMLLLIGSHLRYALTHCLPITFDSLVKQFWTSSMVRTIEGRPQDIVATIDGNEVVVTESSNRTQLQLNDEGGLYACTQQEILEGMRAIDSKSGGWNQFLSSLATGLICLSTGRTYNFSRFIFDGMVGNVSATNHKFLMYPRFLQTILGEPIPLLAAMLPGGPVGGGAANAAGGNPPPPPANLGVDAAADVGAVPQTTSPLVEPQPVFTSSPVRQPTPSLERDPSPRPLSPRPSPVRPQSPTRQPTPSPVRQPTPPPSRPSQTNPFPFMEDDFSRGDYYVSPTRSNDAPPTTGQSAGGAEEPDALTIMSTKLDRCLEKVGVLESELNNTKKTLGSAVLKLVARVKKLEGKVRKTKRRVIISDLEDEEASIKTDFDLEALSELVNATLGSASQIEVEAAVTLSQTSRDAQLRSDGTPERSYQRKDLRRRLRKQSNIPAFEKFQAQVAVVGTSIPADGVPAVSIPAGSSNVSAVSSSEKGKAPVVKNWLGKYKQRKKPTWLEASFAQGSSLPVLRQREIDAASLLYIDPKWFHIMTQIATHTELSRQLLGDDVTEETFSARLADLMRRKRQAVAERIAKEKRDRPITQGQQREFMRNFVKNQSCSLYQTGWSMAKVTKFTDAQLKEEFEKIQRTLERAKILDFKRSLPRSQPALEEPSSKKIRQNEDVPADGFSPDPVIQATQGESLSYSATNVDATNVDGDPKVTTKSETSVSVVPTSVPTVVAAGAPLVASIPNVELQEGSIAAGSESEGELVAWAKLAAWEVMSTPLGEVKTLYRVDRYIVSAAFKTGINSHNAVEYSKPSLVLDELCFHNYDFSLSLVGQLKEFGSLPNLKKILEEEVFIDINIRYMGGFWVMFQFHYKASQDNFKSHVGWAPDFPNSHDDSSESDDESVEGKSKDVYSEKVSEAEEILEIIFEVEEPDLNATIQSEKEPKYPPGFTPRDTSDINSLRADNQVHDTSEKEHGSKSGFKRMQALLVCLGHFKRV
ncbi:hypothetical protein Tco_0889155, partial [Tanacetum coccineum]